MDSKNPYAAPSREATNEASNETATALQPVVDRSRLRFGRAIELPRVCVGCGALKFVKYTQQELQYVPPVLWLAFPIFGVFTALLAGAVTRKASVRIPRCRSCEAREAKVRVLRGPAALVLVVALLIAATLAGNGFPVSGALVAVVSVPAFALGYRRWLGGGVSASYIDEGTITLSGIHPAALQAMTKSGKGADESV